MNRSLFVADEKCLLSFEKLFFGGTSVRIQPMDSDNPDIQLVCFRLGKHLFAIDIMRIREIILPQKLSSHPEMSQLLEGGINFRGSVIPVMNLCKLFATSDAGDCSTGKLLIVVSLVRQTLALAVDNFIEIITVPAREIKPQQDPLDGVVMEHLLGVCLFDDRVVMILDIDSLSGQSEHRDIVHTPSV